MDLFKLDELYLQYKFQVLPVSNQNIRVYSHSSKYFSNADVILLNSNVQKSEVDNISEEVSRLGFSVTIRDYKTIFDAEESLFDGFFDIQRSNKSLDKLYSEYAEKIADISFGEYQYINSAYTDVENENIRTDNIIKTILDDFEQDGPVLIIIEAAAGFGKTSTSYEVINELTKANPLKKIPIFTELSRNRQATIFKYVLFDEINRRFTNVHLELVIKHIVEGRIPVIIDGFDELLKSKSQEISEDKFEDAEPMLETIKELLKGQAKILLTTRRTAIFSDDDFFSWLDKNSSEFTFKRYSISEPTISDWIEPAREKSLLKAGLNIKSISNPVLLGYLRNMNDEKFEACTNNIDFIIDDYIKSLMERENDRQDLNMDIAEQRSILKHISRHFTSNDITSENREALEHRIIESEQQLLFKVLQRFTSGNRPILAQLVNKLIIHAFLDRKGESGQQIGFVNDFILGSFVGENLLDEPESWIGTERFIDFILTAYTPRGKEIKCKIYEILNASLLEYLNIQKQVFVDNYLFGSINRDLENDYFSNIEFRGKFNNNTKIDNCSFSDCEFHDINFDFEKVTNTYFINSNFFNCTFPLIELKGKKIFFTNCDTSPAINFDDYYDIPVLTTEAVESGINEHERHVLEKFWPMGKERFFLHKRQSTLRLGIPAELVADVDDAINSLIKKNLLIKLKGHHSLELNIEYINEIKRILER